MNSQAISVVCNYEGKFVIDTNGIRSMNPVEVKTYWKNNTFYIEKVSNGPRITTITNTIDGTVNTEINYGIVNSPSIGNVNIKGDCTVNGKKYVAGCYRTTDFVKHDEVKKEILNEMWIKTERSNVELNELKTVKYSEISVVIPLASSFKLECNGVVNFEEPLFNCEFNGSITGTRAKIEFCENITNSNLNLKISDQGRVFVYCKCENCNLDVTIESSGRLHSDIDEEAYFNKIVAVVSNGFINGPVALNELYVKATNAKCVKIYYSNSCNVRNEGTADKFVIKQLSEI